MESETSSQIPERVAVIFNPVKISEEKLVSQLKPLADHVGVAEVRWFATSVSDAGTEVARDAVNWGADVVFVAGGDGTVRAAAEGLRGSAAAMALVPLGTGNLLARNLKVPVSEDISEALQVGFQGCARKIDVAVLACTTASGTQEEHSFLVMAGMGLDATVMATTDEKLKKKIGVLAYLQAGLAALKKPSRIECAYQIDDDPEQRAKMNTLLIGNCGSIATNVHLMPDAELDDGYLDLVALNPRGISGWGKVLWHVLVTNTVAKLTRTKKSQQTSRNAELTHRQCRHASFTLQQPQLLELDGDPLTEVKDFTVSIDPQALAVMCP